MGGDDATYEEKLQTGIREKLIKIVNKNRHEIPCSFPSRQAKTQETP